jgi:hypothetical protein
MEIAVIALTLGLAALTLGLFRLIDRLGRKP